MFLINGNTCIQRHFYTPMNFIYCWKAEQNHPNKAISWNVRLFWMPTITICGLLDNEANVRDAFWNITNYYSMFKLLHIYSSRNLFMPKYGYSMILKNLWDVSKMNILYYFAMRLCFGIMHDWNWMIENHVLVRLDIMNCTKYVHTWTRTYVAIPLQTLIVFRFGKWRK